MKQDTLKLLEDSSAILTISTAAATSATKTFGWLDYLDMHAAGIGVMLSIFFGCGYLTFHYFSLKKQSMAEKDKARLDELTYTFNRHQEETKEDLVRITKVVESIFDKLDK